MPFVEFYSDTIGDQFYFIARKPPFTRKKVKEHVTKNLILNIENASVLDEDLSFSTGEAFSWYRLTPGGLNNSIGNEITLAYLKAVHFHQFSDVFGDKPLDIISNYLPHFPTSNKKEQLNTNNILKQAIYDLRNIVEIFSYLPFTRQGTLTLDGDRRLKRGMWIRYEATGELFYINSVAHSYTHELSGVDRTTTLEVVRGMKEKHLDKYFDLMNLEINESVFSNQSASYFETINATSGNWSVNQDIFDFFIQRKQLI